MSLDVTLYGKETKVTCYCCECGHAHERIDREELFEYNITHNLNTMADKAGIYYYLWRPEEIPITKAKQLIEPLKRGLFKLKSKPEYYKQFNPSNGWGSYEGLVKFVREYLHACKKYPNAIVEAYR